MEPQIPIPKEYRDKLIPTLKKNLGNVTATCKQIGISRTTFYQWINDNPDLQRAVEALGDIRKDVFLDILDGTFGIISTACRTLGISRTQVYDWMDNDAHFKAQVDDIREFAKDYVESKMYEGIKLGNTQLIIFYLSRLARDRGYIEKTELEHTFTGKTLRIGFTDEDSDEA